MRRVEQLNRVLDTDAWFLGMDECEREEILRSLATEMEDEGSFLRRLGRVEAERNAWMGLNASDPAGMGRDTKSERVTINGAEYRRIHAVLADAIGEVDPDNFDMDEEVAERAAFAMVSRRYMKPGEDREKMFMADPVLHASYADAWEKVRCVQTGFPLFGKDAEGSCHIVYDGDASGERGSEQPKPKPEKGFWNWAKRHWKGLGIIGLLGAAGAYGAYNMWKDNAANQQRVNQLKSHGGTDDTAKSFNARYGPKLAGPGNIFNSSVLSLYDVHVDNATLAQIIESGARTQDGSVWETVKFVADNLQTPQYMPKTIVEAKCMSKLVKGVNDIAAYPKELKAYALDSKTLLYDLLHVDVASEPAAWGGVRNVANYMLGLIRNGTITTNGLDGEDLQRLLMPIQLAIMDIKTGQPSFTGYQLAIFEKNTTPDASLDGLTPLQWQGKVLNQIKTEKGARYERALQMANWTNAPGWIDANRAYHAEIKDLPDKNDILFVYGAGGLPFECLNPNGSVDNPIVPVKEAHMPSYDSIVGMHFGIPVKERSCNYPQTGTTYHDEPCVWSTSLHKYVGVFMHPYEVAKAYIGTQTKMDLKEGTVDGRGIKVAN
jgi:hypothetical protein